MNYTTSKDYEKLWNLVQEGKEIVCYIGGRSHYSFVASKLEGYVKVFCRGNSVVAGETKIEFISGCEDVELEFLPPTAWIKIESDKDLPPDGMSLLFRIKQSQYTYAGYYTSGSIWMCLCGHSHHNTDEVTHWMPMPEAPGVEQ